MWMKGFNYEGAKKQAMDEGLMESEESSSDGKQENIRVFHWRNYGIL